MESFNSHDYRHVHEMAQMELKLESSVLRFFN